MSEPTVWKWRVALFDDRPDQNGVPETIQTLENVGMEVHIFGGSTTTPPALECLLDQSATALIGGCHILLVDIDWGNVGIDEPVSLPDLHDPSKPVHTKLEEFVAALNRPAQGTPFPQTYIPTKERGFWIAAALSYLAPHSAIGFFSAHPQVLNESIPAALLQFSGQRLLILTKDPVRGIGAADLNDTLENEQREMIRRSEEARVWFFGGVLLMLLLSQEPTVLECGPLWKGDPDDAHWRVTAEGFFPQLAKESDKSEVVKRLLQLAPKDSATYSPGSRRALQSVRHALRKLEASSLAPDDFDEAIRRCADAGLPGQSVLMALIAARAQLTPKSLDHALRVATDVLENGLRQLDDWCQEHHGVFDCDASLREKPDVQGARKASQPLPFALCDLRRAVDTLVDNHYRNRDDLSAGSHRVYAFQSPKHLSVTYVDDSRGFESKATLAEAVRRSAEGKGLDRGLPLALSFALSQPLQSLEVLLSTGQWCVLFSTGSVSPASPVQGANRFGIRWTFRLAAP